MVWSRPVPFSVNSFKGGDAMFRLVLSALICVGFSAACFALVTEDPGIMFRRGDANDDTSINTTDVIYLSNYLYSGGPAPPCMAQADVNDDGSINATDPIYLSNYLFNGGSAPPPQGGDSCP
jgi:hypothetical protein